MNAFVRQLAALSVLWALCELLTPGGAQQRMARFAVSLLVMVALVSALGELLGGVGIGTGAAIPVLIQNGESESLTRIAVQSAANQAWRYCQNIARRAGYLARGKVLLRENGALEQVRMVLALPPDGKPLMSAGELQKRLADALETDAGRVLVTLEGDDGASDGLAEAGGP